MKLFTIIIFFTSLSIANQFEHLPNLHKRDGKIYVEFSSKPFTGKGKRKVESKNFCSLKIFTIDNGITNGAFENWTCDGQLYRKGSMKKNTLFERFEVWDKKSGKKIKDLVYSENGKIIDGWEKDKELDLIWKDGKKTGVQVYSECIKPSSKKILIANYKNDKLIECVDMPKWREGISRHKLQIHHAMKNYNNK